MHVNIVSFEPGGAIPFPETHVMEHGLYVLEGKAVYLLNKDWVEVQEGDFMWLRAFCPQACYAGGPGRFRYLLYKDVNRHPRLRSPPRCDRRHVVWEAASSFSMENRRPPDHFPTMRAADVALVEVRGERCRSHSSPSTATGRAPRRADAHHRARLPARAGADRGQGGLRRG